MVKDYMKNCGMLIYEKQEGITINVEIPLRLDGEPTFWEAPPLGWFLPDEHQAI